MPLSDHKKTTRLLHMGRRPDKQFGFVNPPLYRGSTVLFPTVESLSQGGQNYWYGRKGTPTMDALEGAMNELEGADQTILTPSGLSAISTALLSLVKTGDHVLVSDSVYQPTRGFCDEVLARLGVEITYYDPRLSQELHHYIQPNSKLIFTESPGSQTFEIQDIPAIAALARHHNLLTLIDNTWATPLFFKPLDHGIDISIHSGTKYLIGHADGLVGTISCNTKTAARVRKTAHALGICAGAEDIQLALRGLRTLNARLKIHQQSALDIARWLETRAEIDYVLHPALQSHPDHEIWQRDFTGSTGLFTAVLTPYSKQAVAHMLDHLELFGMGWSWGGYESLVIPFDPSSYRTATSWSAEGPALRFHIGLEDVGDLKADLTAGFDRLKLNTG